MSYRYRSKGLLLYTMCPYLIFLKIALSALYTETLLMYINIESVSYSLINHQTFGLEAQRHFYDVVVLEIGEEWILFIYHLDTILRTVTFEHHGALMSKSRL